MKSKNQLRFHSTLATTICCGALLARFAAPSASALTYSWDGSDTAISGAQGGSGTWDSNTTSNWWDGSADVVWPISGTDNDAIFGGTAGIVTVASVTVNDLLFNTTGYILSGASTLALSGTAPTITTGSGISATIGNITDTVLAGSAGLAKAGLGTLTLNGSAVNTFTGGVTINGGTLALNLNSLGTPTNLIDSGNFLSIGGGTLAVTGKSSGDTVQTFAGTHVTSGNSAISLNRSTGTTGTLNLGTVTRSNGATVGFTTTNPSLANTPSTTVMIKVSNAASTLNGGLAAWAFAGNSTTNGGRWAAVDASGTIKVVLANAVPGTNWPSVTDASSIYTTNTAATLGANATAQGLQNAATGNIAVALGTNTLTVNGLSSINGTRTWSFTSTGAGGITIGSEKELILCGAGNFGFAVPISNNGGGLSGLTHAGGGTATFTGVNAYTGQTTVNSGKMVISTGGSINTSSGITVNGGTFVQANTATAITPTVTLQGGTVDGTGTINTVNVSDLSTAKITNGDASTSALSIGDLTFSGDASIDIRTAGSAGLAVTGTLTTTPANGTVTINVTSAPAWTIGTTYNLISYGTLAGTLGNFTKGSISGLGGRQTADLVTSGNNIALSIGGDKALWTGAASSDWTTSAVASPFNWKTQVGGADTDFLVNDDVVFDDTALSTNVTIFDATVSPFTTLFNNSAKSYTLSGGSITSGTLTKDGTNNVSLTNTNTYTGATTINGGTLQVSGGSAIADAGLVILGNVAGAAFQVVGSETIGSLSGGGATGGAVSIDASQVLTLSTGAQTYAGTVSGDGALTNSGAYQTLNGALSHTGGINVTAGVLTLGSSGNIYAGTTTISPGKGIIVTANGALGSTGAGNETTVTGTGGGLNSGILGFSGGINYSTAERIVGSGVGNTGTAGNFAAVQRGFIQAVSGNNTFAGDIELNAGGISRIGTQDGASLTLTGAITQATGVTTASILFRAGSTPGDFVTLSNAGNSLGVNSQVYTAAASGYAGVRLGINNALPTNLTISCLGGSYPSTALDLAGFDQSLNGLIAGGALGVMNIINLNSGKPSTLTLNPTADQSTTNTFIVGGGGLGVINLIKDGAFTQTLGGANTYTGTTTINAGTLALGASNVLPDTAISIGNATLDAANFTDTLGTLDVTSAAKINLGSGATLAFAPASPAWTGTLTITGTFVSGSSLKFGSDANGLAPAQLALISAAGFNGFGLDSNGFLTATPVLGYSAWQADNFTTGGIDEDHDNDGVDNGIEYFMGLIGNAFTANPGIIGNTVTWRMGATYIGVYGIDYVVQTSSDLSTWNPASVGVGAGFVTLVPATSVTYTLTAGAGPLFVRLKVTGP